MELSIQLYHYKLAIEIGFETVDPLGRMARWAGGPGLIGASDDDRS